MDPERLQIIEVANKSFGESGWSFSISNVALDYIDNSQSGSYTAGTSVVVRVQRSNGIFREDVGYGSSSGTIKAGVISKAKKDAVTDGLIGAVSNFGGDVARKVHIATPRKSVNDAQGTSPGHQGNYASNAPISPVQAAVKPSVSKHVVGGKIISSSALCAQVMPSVSSTSPVMHPKSDPAQVTPVPRPSSPLAVPLPQQPQTSQSSCAQMSEEELAKIERKRRQRQLQEEFRKKHLLEQALAQSKAVEKGAPKVSPHQSREPLKEQQSPNHCRSPVRGNGTSALDDDVLLSTQDMEAISAIAANNTNVSRHSPIISSPSIARPSAAAAPTKRSGGYKHHLSSYAFNPEKKPKGV